MTILLAAILNVADRWQEKEGQKKTLAGGQWRGEEPLTASPQAMMGHKLFPAPIFPASDLVPSFKLRIAVLLVR